MFTPWGTGSEPRAGTDEPAVVGLAKPGLHAQVELAQSAEEVATGHPFPSLNPAPATMRVYPVQIVAPEGCAQARLDR